MDEIVYESLSRYYHALEMKGYMAYGESVKLLLLVFYKDFVFHDYRGLLSKEDYQYIEKALNCLFGSSCLIPYPDYLKMGKLYLGEITEMAHRVKNLEDTSVVKLIHDLDQAEGDVKNDIQVVADEEGN